MPQCRQHPLNLHATTKRHPRLPVIYEVFGHVKHPESNPGRDLLIFIRPTPSAMAEEADFEKNNPVPKGTKEEIDAQGWQEMVGGTYLWGRNAGGSLEEEDDVLLAYVVDRRLYSTEDLERLDKATLQALGPPHLRTTSQVFMERHCEPVRPNTRCYPICTTYEKPRNVVTPAANVKNTPRHEVFREIAHALTAAIVPMAMVNMGQAPENVQRQLREIAESIVMARVGTCENYAYQSIQCNIAAVPGDDSGSLEEQMGFFGGPHYDEHDSPVHLTNMLVNSQLPPGYDPGYFFLLGLGVYIRLENYTGFNFQGNRRHGGSGPFPPKGVTPDSSAYRFTMISYPPESMVSSSSRMRMGASSSGATFLTPEMRSWRYKPDNKQDVNYPQFLRDGTAFMDPQSIAQMTSYSMMDFARYYSQGVPQHIGIDIDTAKFTSAFSYIDQHGERQSVTPWKKAPPVYQFGPVFDARKTEHDAEVAAWDEYYTLNAGLVPARFMASSKLQDDIARLSEEQRKNRRRPVDGGCQETDTNEAPERGEAGPLGANAKALTSQGQPRLLGSCDPEAPPPAKRPRMLLDFVEVPGRRHLRSSTGMPNAASLPPQNTRSSTTALAGNEKKKGRGKQKDNKGKRKRPGNGSGKTRYDDMGTDSNQHIGFAFCHTINAHALELELLQLQSEISEEELESEGSQNPEAEQSILDEIDDLTQSVSNACDALDNAMLNPSPSAALTDVLAGAHQMEKTLRRQNLATRRARQVSIYASTRVWRWLDHDLPEATIHRLEQDKTPSGRAEHGWLPQLVRKVYSMHLHRWPKASFSSVDLGFHCEEELDKIVQVDRGARIPLLVGEQLEEAVAQTVRDVVVQWIGYKWDAEQKRAWFANIIVDCLGEEALTIDSVWAMFSHFKLTYVVEGKNGYRARDISTATPFRKAILSHPISCEGSTEHALYSQYQQLLAGTLSLDQVEIGGRQGPKWLRYAHMWKISLQYLVDPSTPSTDKFFQLLQRDPDFYLPIRDRAPARIRSSSIGGPYHASVIRTNSGIFSALLWRGITYRSEFFYDNPMVYSSWQALEETVTNIINMTGDRNFTMKSAYFCKKDAYGQPAAKREMSLAEKYWSSLQERHWDAFAHEDLALTDRLPTFTNTIEYFRPSGPAEALIFPQLGPLGSFALVCDLAAAGICLMPTIGEMASAIMMVDRGAVAGLVALGLASKPLPTSKAEKLAMLEKGLLILNDMVISNFTEEERLNMGYNLITLEHSLCKFSRAIGKRAL